MISTNASTPQWINRWFVRSTRGKVLTSLIYISKKLWPSLSAMQNYWIRVERNEKHEFDSSFFSLKYRMNVVTTKFTKTNNYRILMSTEILNLYVFITVTIMLMV